MGKHAERRLLNVFAEKLTGFRAVSRKFIIELSCENIPIFIQRSFC